MKHKEEMKLSIRGIFATVILLYSYVLYFDIL